MNLSYNVTSSERKSLVAAISHELNAPTKYLGAPTFAYEVGGYHIDKTGTVTGEDNRELVANLCGLHSFQAISEEYDEPKIETENNHAFEELELTEREELGLGCTRREDFQGENGMRVEDVPESNNLVIEVPLTGFTPEKLDNLAKLVTAKAPLLMAALGVEYLPIQQTEDTLRFPWFNGEINGNEVKAYATLIEKICVAANGKSRVAAKEREVENPKYAMRCWLLSLGFIGDEYKLSRKILLQNLNGNSAYAKLHITVPTEREGAR